MGGQLLLVTRLSPRGAPRCRSTWCPGLYKGRLARWYQPDGAQTRHRDISSRAAFYRVSHHGANCSRRPPKSGRCCCQLSFGPSRLFSSAWRSSGCSSWPCPTSSCPPGVAACCCRRKSPLTWPGSFSSPGAGLTLRLTSSSAPPASRSG